MARPRTGAFPVLAVNGEEGPMEPHEESVNPSVGPAETPLPARSGSW